MDAQTGLAEISPEIDDSPEHLYLNGLLNDQIFEYITLVPPQQNVDVHSDAEEVLDPFEITDETGAEGAEREFQVIRIPHHMSITADLPPGYCFKGSAARAVMHKLLGDSTYAPRDIDILAITDFHPDLSHMHELEEKFMPDDSQGENYRSEIIDLWRYFQTRDFTLNEVLVDGTYLYATPSAVVDLHEKVIRPTEYSASQWRSYSENDRGLSPKLLVKAVRLLVEFEEMYGKGKISQIKEWQFKADNIPLFYLALGIDRARERGIKIAEEFYRKLITLGVVGSLPTSLQGRSYSDLALRINAALVGPGDGEDGRKAFIFSFDPEEESGMPSSKYDEYLDMS